MFLKFESFFLIKTVAVSLLLLLVNSYSCCERKSYVMSNILLHLNNKCLPISELHFEYGQEAVRVSLFPEIFPPFINFLPYGYPYPDRRPVVEGLWWSEGHTILNGMMKATGIPVFKPEPFCPKIDQRGSLHTKRFGVCWNDSLEESAGNVPFEMGKKDSFPLSVKVLGDKARIVQSLRKLHKKMLGEKNFHQKSFILPGELAEWRAAFWKTKIVGGEGDVWLFKPMGGVESRGILVIKDEDESTVLSLRGKSGIIQKFLEEPFLFHDRKVEVRTYVLLTGIQPLKIYQYFDGVVTVSREPFHGSKVSYDCAHVLRTPCRTSTRNVTIDKIFISLGMERDDLATEASWLWEASSLFTELKRLGYSEMVDKAKKKMVDITVKTILSSRMELLKGISNYNSNNDDTWTRYHGFQLLGIDFHFDKELNPYLLEVNVFPGMDIGDHTLQSRVRLPLFQEMMNMAGFHFPSHLSTETRRSLGIDEYYADVANPAALYHGQNHSSMIKPNLSRLTTDDLLVLMQFEDEMSVAKGFQNIFPRENSDRYLPLMEPINSYYYERLIMLWEKKFHKHREEGIKLLRCFAGNCSQK